MATWNQFSDEVRQEIRTVENYGLGKAPTSGITNYKAQALRLLAENKLLHERIELLESSQSAAIDLFDCVEDFTPIAELLRMPVQQVRSLATRAMGG